MRVPLKRRDRSIRSYAIVDPDVFEVFSGMAWHEHRGYAAHNTRTGNKVYMHRLVLGLELGDMRNVHHINRKRLDNRRSNLTTITRAEHMQLHNRDEGRQPRRRPAEPLRGVWKNGNRWLAQLKANGRRYYLGQFATEEEARMVVALFQALVALSLKRTTPPGGGAAAYPA